MKPYGREKKLSSGGIWKKDYHIHRNGHRLQNWWEDICKFYTRSVMKQKTKKEIDKELND